MVIKTPAMAANMPIVAVFLAVRLPPFSPFRLAISFSAISATSTNTATIPTNSKTKVRFSTIFAKNCFMGSISFTESLSEAKNPNVFTFGRLYSTVSSARAAKEVDLLIDLLSSRLYCRLWNRTISACLRLQTGSRTLPPVGNRTLPRRFVMLFT